MKRFIWTLILFGAAYAIYQYYPQLQKTASERTSDAQSKPAETSPAKLEEKPATKAEATAEKVAVTPEPVAPEPVKPVIAEPPAAAKPQDDYELRYPLPQFAPIESLVKNWLDIPDSAFPKNIVINQDVQCALPGGAGGAVYPKGSKAVAIVDEAGTIVIAPNATSPLRGRVPIDQTDLKSILATAYEQFKKRRVQFVMAQRENARAEAKAAANRNVPVGSSFSSPDDLTPPGSILAKIGPKPAQNADGTMPAIMASFKAGKGKEVASAEGKKWGGLKWKEIEGEPWWVINVAYTAKTLFGEFPTEALALIRKGEVVKWIYAGTLEPVP